MDGAGGYPQKVASQIATFARKARAQSGSRKHERVHQSALIANREADPPRAMRGAARAGFQLPRPPPQYFDGT
jgi:hypothetical protein